MLFRRVIYGCSGRLYTVHGGDMLFRGVICCSGGLYGCSGGYILKKIMMCIVATNVVASRPPKCRPTGMPTSGANLTRSEGVNNLREVFRKSKNRGIFPNLMVLE